MSVKQRLEEIFRDVFEDDELEIYDEMSAKDIDDWDSLTHIQLILEIEKAFSVKFTIEEITKTRNVGEFIELLTSKINK
ncbi:MAG TPA: acyl carrier protein [Clostridiales bacterium]|jgi:acyl carrier protein|nr:acyl carrier protein [Clostridiales bacterium]HHU71574.1 acyl carrier protein [Clostridiales bacterium]